MAKGKDHIGKVSWKEKEKIRHEINTYYSKYSDKLIIWHRSIGLDNCYYIYIVENYGFDQYRMIARIPDMEVR